MQSTFLKINTSEIKSLDEAKQMYGEGRKKKKNDIDQFMEREKYRIPRCINANRYCCPYHLYNDESVSLRTYFGTFHYICNSKEQDSNRIIGHVAQLFNYYILCKPIRICIVIH